jgi:N-acetylmuramoyl-L-alanine amidase
MFWRFETNQNRLIFTTDERVQPRAQLIPNPSRIVIDLPGVMGSRPVNQSIGGLIKSVRVGQFDERTTRLVIEIAPGYTVDPRQVKIRGLSPTQWTVELPQPQPTGQTAPLPPPVNPVNPSTPSPPTELPQSQGSSSDFQVTRNGLVVNLQKNGNAKDISIKRSRDRQTIQIDLPDANLPSSLVSQTLSVNQYGVSKIQFVQTSTSPSSARLVLTVSEDSPNWRVVYNRLGGLILFPDGRLENFQSNVPSPTPSPIRMTNPSSSQLPTIGSVQLTNNNTQLLIQADRGIQGSGRWNSSLGAYEIRIPNADLSPQFRGPQLDRNSPIYQLKVRQEDNQTVVLLVQPSVGVSFGNLLQPSGPMLVLEVQSVRATTSSNPISLPSYPTTSPPPFDPNPTESLPTARNGRVLVVIDPGHGGKDPGAIGLGGIQEKDIILPISQMLAQLLEKSGLQVMLTRNSDYFVSLQGRTQMANRVGADLFVSIHANSMGKGRADVSGLEVYYFGDRRLADTIQKNILKSVDIRDRGVRKARFYVLRTSKMPSTLVEVGFVTGNEDAAKLTNPAYQQQMAEAIARGVLEFIQRNRR